MPSVSSGGPSDSMPSDSMTSNFLASTVEQRPRSSGSPRTSSSILGIWRIGQTLHKGPRAAISLAQPADAVGSPRWDYVLKRSLSGKEELEARRHIVQFIAAATGVSHPNLVPVLDASAISCTGRYRASV